MIRVVKETDLWLAYSEPELREKFPFKFQTCEWCESKDWGLSYSYRACSDHSDDAYALWLTEKHDKASKNFSSLGVSNVDRS